MDGYPEPVPIEIQAERPVSQSYFVKCDGELVEVKAAGVEDMAAALNRYLGDKKNTEGFPAGLEPFLRPADRLWVSEGQGDVRFGRWTLSCDPGRRFVWAVRPTRTLRLVAGLQWDEDQDRWFVPSIRLSNLSLR